MAIRKILTREQPILRRKAVKVSRFDDALERLVRDMWDTMYEAPGVGLAAPQIGVPLRVLVAEWKEEGDDGTVAEDHVALVNPEIIKRAEEELKGTEGCLSIPGFLGDNIRRAAAVTVKARDPRGKEVRIHAEGWFARILQHEIDHLDGILFTDRLDRPEDLREVSEEESEQEAEGQPAPAARTPSAAKAAAPSKAPGKTRVNGASGTSSSVTPSSRAGKPAGRAS